MGRERLRSPFSKESQNNNNNKKTQKHYLEMQEKTENRPFKKEKKLFSLSNKIVQKTRDLVKKIVNIKNEHNKGQKW